MAALRIADQVGRVLSGRYRLLRPLGTGASAHVYVAEDVTLRRRVALKLLHPALAEDGAFLRRFRAEAQVVAALRHPNILRVYDWGEDSGSPYLVTELLEGGSLRALLDAGHLLSPAQAAKVGADVARALAHAHRRGLVHRDVKPANLIFDDEGRVSVADFGLARALAEASWTEPAGAVLGTARYAAPEQVRGEVLDDRADVYSLAVVLVEATTGEVPFVTDTTIGTLMARVDRPLPVPATLGPLAAVLQAAGHPSPAQRLDATHLAAELERAAGELPPASALPLVGPPQGAGVGLDPDPTNLAVDSGPAWLGPAPPAIARDAGWAPADRGGGSAGTLLAGDLTVPPAGPSDPTRETLPSPPDQAGEDGTAGGDRAPRRRRRKWPFLVVAALLAAGGAAAAAVILLAPPPLRPVPSLAGDTQSQAGAALAASHLHLKVAGRRYDQNSTAGRVISQIPPAGKLREGQTVAVVVSLGPPPVAVPDLTGKTQAQASALLGATHLVVGKVTLQYSTTVAQGTVISWTHGGATVAQGTPVDLVVSNGLPFVAVPALNGTAQATYAGAQSALTAAGLAATETQQFSDTVHAGAVIGTNPGPGTSVRMHTTVTVVVSKGPDVLPVPNVYGMSVAAATQTLTGQGFTVSGVTGNPTATVTSTNPGQGAVVHRGSSVQLITG